jgi:hypothetical protein
MPSMDDLPNDLLLHIFENESLSMFDLLRARSVCLR